MFFGKVTDYRGQKQLANPEVDLLDEEDRLQITPIYPQSDKLRLYSKDFRGWEGESLRRAGDLVEPLPGWVLDQHDFVDRTGAFRGIHVPESAPSTRRPDAAWSSTSCCASSSRSCMRKRKIEATSQGIEHDTSGELVGRFLARAPLRAHRRPAHGHRRDHRRPGPARIPMHRLLQGDVGAGKTVVAIAALLTAVQGGHQGAFMAPTEVLAEQHAPSMRPLLEGISVPDGGALALRRPARSPSSC